MTHERWAIQWHSKNQLDGERLELHGGLDWLFTTRAAARDFIEREFGYIAKRPDLRREPHGWRMPRAVKVNVTVEVAA